MEQTARDLSIDAGKHAEGLKRAFDVAAPAPIPWWFAAQQYASGRWHLLANDGAASLITHTGIAGHKSTSIVAMAGALEDCLSIMPEIERAAKEAGSTMVVYVGRKGWARVLCGYSGSDWAVGVKGL